MNRHIPGTTRLASTARTFRVVSVLILAFSTLPFLASTPPAFAQTADAEAAAGDRAVAIAESIFTGDADSIWTTVQEHLTPATLEQRPEASWRMLFAQISEDLARSTIRGVGFEDQSVEVEAVRPDARTVRFSFGIEQVAPYRLEGFSVELGGDADDDGNAPSVEPGMSRAAVRDAMQAFIDRHVGDSGFSGTVLVAKDGEPWLEGAYGLAHRGYEIANHTGTRFDLGSINKLFTQVAIAQLAAAGALALDDTIATLLPDYPNLAIAKDITVQQLARHTSGLGDIFGPAFFAASKTQFRQPEDFFPLFADQPLLFAPGSGRQYSNAGYQVLGAIVAARSGMTYHDYIAKKVWAPAGMTETAFISRDEPTPDVAVGYTHNGDSSSDDGALRNNLFRLPVIGSPAGSSFSTIHDMLRFDQALRSAKLVPLEWTTWVLTGTEPGGPAPPLDGLGLGFAGGAPGVNAMYEINGPWTIIVLANQDPPAAGDLARPLARASQRLTH